ncbi:MULTISPECIES: phosphatidylserine decarboxylase family protein [Empedobacter]|uniref:Phosphatidylserine decarboxylase proenzyme n=3 Tax=Empedobacter TaxID=59734 RepID=A0A427BHI3_9FLAO|nr:MULTISPECIES: phosphatidylserine decarboxylase family protein [Empedobacter]MDH0659809.1 phosphatidylserine decarboxylase family protein [Empedobacter sp. GD03865]MDH0673835.1 phosphatidylserine decarboxylase family protein [Empedobacter sp. GD03861]MDH1602663.1 phosphatidylserine decarboxylase family protein [Empedobacter sp. GD03739]RRT87502.1 phosphatidylserine decarboxylase family protein [Empedobacter falsenii]RRT88632.1 phosphatidylserine decarboxylase family protein [Empedobacter fal
MKLHREGTAILIGCLILFAIATGVLHYFFPVYGLLFALPLWILYGFVVWFFRNPIRESDSSENCVIAPVDGKVVVLEEVYESEFLNQKCIQLSIFMTPLNVHVTRYPVNGKVIYSKYHPGKFLVAFHPKSSELNERTTVVVENTDHTKVLFRQIAGAVARRIVCYSKENDTAVAGKEYGFIKFGSRVDIFLPLDTEINVKVGDKTKGGIQKIAQLK